MPNAVTVFAWQDKGKRSDRVNPASSITALRKTGIRFPVCYNALAGRGICLPEIPICRL